MPGHVESRNRAIRKTQSKYHPARESRKNYPHPFSTEPEKAQIAVEGADHLYREIRVPNALEDENGQKVKLKEGADVDVKIEADPVVTTSGNSRQDSNRSQTPM